MNDSRFTRRSSLVRLGGLLVTAAGAAGLKIESSEGAGKAPYASRPNRDVRNVDDSIYRNGGKRSQLSVKKNSAGVYVASIVMGVHRS